LESLRGVVFIMSLVCMSLFTMGAGKPDIYNIKEEKVKVDNLERSYLYYVPKKIIKNPKILFVLHGSTMTDKAMLGATGFEFNRLAEKTQDTIVVYPQGYENYWNDGRKSATYKANILNLNDIEFISKILKKFEKEYKISKTERFVVGFSNGGHMVYKIAMENPEMFKGYGVIRASLPVEENSDIKNNQKKGVSILIVNGTSDPVNPYNGGEVIVGDGKNRGKVISTKETFEYWVSLLDEKEVKKEVLKEEGEEKNIYNTKKKKVELISIIDGGHVVENPYYKDWDKKFGHVNEDIDLPRQVIEFFNSLK